jgi:hypothetical protein
VFSAVGNHEVWADTDVEVLLASFPYLKKFGVSDKQLIYKFDFRKGFGALAAAYVFAALASRGFAGRRISRSAGNVVGG